LLWVKTGSGHLALMRILALLPSRIKSNQSAHTSQGRFRNPYPTHIFLEAGQLWFCQAKLRAIRESNLRNRRVK
jgi:hypothetical protein